MTEDKTEVNNENNGELNDSPYSSLTGSFGHAELEARDRFYNAGDTEALLRKIKDILKKSPNGARLLEVAESKNVSFKFIKSKKLQSATTPNLELFLAAEPGQDEPHMTQVLECGGALREIEQYLMGFKIPQKEDDPLEKANMAHTKFLDKIVSMCRIAIDLESLYSEEVKKAIKAFGYEDIYKAQVNALGDEQTKKIYMDAQKSDAD